MLKKLLLLLIVMVVMAIFWAKRDYEQALSRPVVTDSDVFVIKKGESFRQITRRLQQKWAVNPYWFRVIAYQKKVTNQLKAGEYILQPGMTLPDILAVFVSGKARQYAITFPEGWTFKQIRQRLLEEKNLRHTLDKLDDQALLKRLGSPYSHPEGLFFPETYFFEKNTLDLELLKRAYQKMQQVLQQEWVKRQPGLPLETPYQALILASIVEKETGKPSERAMIAGVFIRRLRKGMLLQTDPTVIYGMGERYQGNIRRKDLKQATPYNTYVIKGLPPTPIAMPGREAIHAVMHPTAGNSLYFVASGDGGHVFSATLREHVNAVNKYQKKRR
ncbi:endolytic transglycosylase MltG [methane-oxidizing endosymbiont of Gigantopelta aegis]|uniref:endolytic transglycosylase MltG n=1 Tax=methane-oxidizing endosymbiont of Gigantopelta aegis TaxID=2794938 RepID=UPI0018DBCEB9|nr:endolytic transglycosylase MltG [methane-oxidizing endosymbiont of Gigantopelta aegis]